MSEGVTNFILNEVKNVGIALATVRLFNEGQDKICHLQPFEALAKQVCFQKEQNGLTIDRKTINLGDYYTII